MARTFAPAQSAYLTALAAFDAADSLLDMGDTSDEATALYLAADKALDEASNALICWAETVTAGVDVGRSAAAWGAIRASKAGSARARACEVAMRFAA